MKKHYRKLCRRDLFFELIIGGLIIILGGGFLFFQFSSMVFSDGNTHLIRFSIAVIFIMIILIWITFYKSATSYIKWYKEILDSIPIPVIVTDRDAKWQQVNETARKIMKLNQDSNFEELNSRHLIDANDNIKKSWWHEGMEYRVVGNRMCCGGKDAGYLILLNNVCELMNTCETQTDMIAEIKRILGQMSMATNHFNNCVNNFVERTNQQSDIIMRLLYIVERLTLGEIETIHEEMCSIKSDMEWYIESDETYLETMRSVVKELDMVRSFIDDAIYNVGRIL